MTKTVLLLPGDGIGPEVTAAARACLSALKPDLRFVEKPFGGAAIDAVGDPLPDDTLAAAQSADAVFLGAVGGPKWDNAPKRPEVGLLGIRKALGLFANLRPVRLMSGMEEYSPLKSDRVAGADILIVRELTGGMYFGEKRLEQDSAFDGCAYSRAEIERIARVAFDAARGRRGHVTSVDKANVLATSKLWRQVVDDVARDYPDVTLVHGLVDAVAMQIITDPKRFDVILTENLFGDILSDEASVIAGSIGLLGSASLGSGGLGLFEPIHGSAPDIAGQDKANPAGAIASAAMLLRHGLGETHLADQLERALAEALTAGPRTADLGGDAGCRAFTDMVLSRLP